VADEGDSDDSGGDEEGWSPSEDAALKRSVEIHGRNFKKIAKELGSTRTEAQLEARMAKVRAFMWPNSTAVPPSLVVLRRFLAPGPSRGRGRSTRTTSS